MSTIAAGTTSGTALVSTGNTDGTLQLQVNGTTPSVTLATTGAIGVGSTPGYGTSGQVLTSAGSASAPTWTTLSASAMTFVTSVTASNSATVDLEDAMTAYQMYCVIISNLDPSIGGSTFNARLKISGTYSTTTYNSQNGYSNFAATAYNVNSTNGASNLVIARAGLYSTNDWAQNSSFVILYINNPSSTTQSKPLRGEVAAISYGTPGASFQTFSGYNDATGAVTGIRFFFNSGNIKGGVFRLYGISNS